MNVEFFMKINKQNVLIYLPLILGIFSALLLFALFIIKALNSWSANTDHPWMGYDYFNLTRCSLAVRFGTNPFTAHMTYVDYGPYATNFASHPALCVLAMPLSYLPPWCGFWILNALNLCLHLGIIIFFGLKIVKNARSHNSLNDFIKNCFIMIFSGLFMPWYVLYYQGQYHSVSVLAVTLVLAFNKNYLGQIFGFVISAISKPVLAPAALVLFFRKQWMVISITSIILAVIFFPWFIMCYDVRSGLKFCLNETFLNYIKEASLYTKYCTVRWNQELTLASALNEFMGAETNLKIRYMLSIVFALWSCVFIAKRAYVPAVSLSVMCFFVLYARGFEYYYTLFVPVVLALFTEPQRRYCKWWIIVVLFIMASPTAWVVYKYLYGFSNPMEASGDIMFNANKWLYYIFLWQKPAAMLFLSGAIIKTQWVYRKDGNTT